MVSKSSPFKGCDGCDGPLQLEVIENPHVLMVAMGTHQKTVGPNAHHELSFEFDAGSFLHRLNLLFPRHFVWDTTVRHSSRALL